MNQVLSQLLPPGELSMLSAEHKKGRRALVGVALFVECHLTEESQV